MASLHHFITFIILLRLDTVARNRVLFRRPRAEIDQLAALAAERAPRRALVPLDAAPAGRASNDAVHVQTVSWNLTSSVACAGRALGSVQRRKRMLQRCWPPLTSGNRSVPA